MSGGIYESILFELNACRSNPSKYSSKLSATLKYYKGKIFEKPGYPAYETEEGPENVQACIKYLKSVRPAIPLEWSEGLSKAAQAHVDDLGPKGLSGHDSSDGSDAAVRVERFGQWSGQLGENIDYGNCEGEDIVVSLLIDDGVLARGQRLNIMKREHVFVGIGFGYHSEYEYMCVVIFAEGFIENLPKVIQEPKEAKKESKPRTRPKRTSFETFDITGYTVEGVSQDEIKEIKGFFDQVDYENSGAVEMSEILAALDNQDFDLSGNSLMSMLNGLKNDVPKIDFDEFIEIVKSGVTTKNQKNAAKAGMSKPEESKRGNKDTKNVTIAEVNQMKEIFDAYDSEGLGWINLEDLVDQITENDYEPGVLEIVDVLISLDTRGKKKVTFSDLIQLLDEKKDSKKGASNTGQKKGASDTSHKKTVAKRQESEVVATTYTYKGQTYTKTTKKTVTKLPANRGLFDPEEYLRTGLTEEEILEIKDAFDLFDIDQTGTIETQDLRQAMERQGFNHRSPTIFKMICELDTEGRGRVNFEEFLEMMTENEEVENSKEEIRKLFSLFDIEETGFIELKNLKKIAKELGENLKEEDIIELITKSDTDGDGKVSFQEFYDIMSKNPY